MKQYEISGINRSGEERERIRNYCFALRIIKGQLAEMGETLYGRRKNGGRKMFDYDPKRGILKVSTDIDLDLGEMNLELGEMGLEIRVK